MWGGVCGALAAGGLLLVVARLVALRRPQLSVRVLPYVRDVPRLGRGHTAARSMAGELAGVGMADAVVRVAAEAMGRVLGGAVSVRRRLERAGLEKTVHEFRVEQVLWGVTGFVSMAAIGVVRSLAGSGDPLSSALLCAVAFGFGVIGCDVRLSSRVTAR
jgi:tight adherence protein C